MKKREKEILIHLLKNSKLSDREIAKKLGTSQSTITRMRHKLEEEFIQSYTAVPHLDKMGVSLIAFTFGKVNPDYKTVEKLQNFYEKHPKIVFGGVGEGLGKTGLIVSFHKDFSDYSIFMSDLRLISSEFASSLESFIVPTDRLFIDLSFGKAIEFLLKEDESKKIDNKREYSKYYKRKLVDSL